VWIGEEGMTPEEYLDGLWVIENMRDDLDDTTEARASQWARIEEVAALPPALRERLYTVLLDAVPHLAAEKQLFRAVSTVLGAVIEYNESTRKRS
jgi:adenylylsulfate kinase-like enzyme